MLLKCYNKQMGKIKKTLTNPHGLSTKQALVIAEVVNNVKHGRRPDITKATDKIYNAVTKNGSAVIANNNINKLNFREALIEGLNNANILGSRGKLSQKLAEGLDATTETDKTDYRTRLAYIQEINKVLGNYALEKSQKQSIRVNLDLTPDQIKQRIKTLQGELIE